MSGISGGVFFQKKSNALFEKMDNAIIKRGENLCVYEKENVYLSQRSSVISKISVTIQGIKEYAVIFSGKIFNKDKLRQQLLFENVVLNDGTDGELCLKAFLKWGEKSVARLNGNFAYAIWDCKEKKLFAARDRMGVMPFYFYLDESELIFSSEIKGLMSSGIIKSCVDREGLRQLLLLGPSKSCGSGIIKGIKELSPGQLLVYDKNSLAVKTYWKPTANMHSDNLQDTIERTKELIENSIIRQLSDDNSVPACFLSGGLDSSIITAIASKEYAKQNKTLKTFSVDYEGNEKYFVKNSYQSGRDNYYIDIMQKFCGTFHKYFVLDTMDVAEKIYAAGVARDLPGMADIDSSLLLLCENVKKECDICLSGEVADELFGGYPWYHREELLYRDSFPWLNAMDMRMNLFNKSLLQCDGNEYVHSKYREIIDYTDYLSSDSIKDRRIREMFMLNYYYFMQTLIDRSDRMSTHSGLEVRLPFCDNEIIDYAYNMPFDFKALYGREKGIMRAAFENALPKEIIERKKTPYPKTFNPIYTGYVISQAEKLMNDKSSIIPEIVNKDYFDYLKNSDLNLELPWYGQLMRLPQVFAYLIQLDVFFRTFNIDIVE